LQKFRVCVEATSYIPFENNFNRLRPTLIFRSTLCFNCQSTAMRDNHITTGSHTTLMGHLNFFLTSVLHSFSGEQAIPAASISCSPICSHPFSHAERHLFSARRNNNWRKENFLFYSWRGEAPLFASGMPVCGYNLLSIDKCSTSFVRS